MQQMSSSVASFYLCIHNSLKEVIKMDWQEMKSVVTFVFWHGQEHVHRLSISILSLLFYSLSLLLPSIFLFMKNKMQSDKTIESI